MSSRLEIWLAALLAVAIGLAVWAAHRTPKPPEQDMRASTLLAGPQGSRAVYDVLIRLGRPVQRRRAPLYAFASDSSRRAALLVVLDPPMPLEPAELEQVVRYVRQGGAVLSAGSGGGILRCVGWRLQQPDRWSDDSIDVSVPAGFSGSLPPVDRVLVPRSKDSTQVEELRGLVKRKDESQNGCARLVAERREPLLYAANGRPILLRLWYHGGGSITLASDPGWFTNQVWRDTDVPLIALPLLTAPLDLKRGGRRRIVVDEYHQGFGGDEHSLVSLSWDWLRQSPVGWAVLQILAVALVWLAVVAVRFGPARDVVERRRRSPLEHLEALGAGLESAHDEETAVQRLVAGLQRRLSVHRSGSAGKVKAVTDSWLEGLELAMRRPEGRAAVRRLRHLVNERNGSDGDRVFGAAQAVEDVWEELRPRSKREQF